MACLSRGVGRVVGREFVPLSRDRARSRWSNAQPGFCAAAEHIGERFKSPLRHEPVAYRSTTVVSVLVYSFTRRHRSPAVSLSVLAQTADGADASERRSALLESDRSSQWPTAAVRWVGHQLAGRRAAHRRWQGASAARALDVGRRGPRRDKGAAAGRRPPVSGCLCRTSFWRPGLNGDPLTWRKAHPSRRRRGANQHANTLNAGNRWSGCLDGRTRHSAWPVPRMGAHVCSHCSQSWQLKPGASLLTCVGTAGFEPATP
jgi:hypothetical protein